MKSHFSSLDDAQLSVVVGKLAGQSNARIHDGQAWVGRAYSLVDPGRDHQEQVEKSFTLSTSCEVIGGRPVFTCNDDARIQSQPRQDSRGIAQGLPFWLCRR